MIGSSMQARSEELAVTPQRSDSTDEAERPEPIDRAILERHGRGDPQAFAELVRLHSTPVYSYLARCGVPPSERDDLFQEVFCKVHRALAKEAFPDGPVRPWLLAIAVNTA